MISETLDGFLNEIRAEEAHRDADAIQTVIAGKRDLAYLVITTHRIIDPRDAIAALGLAINKGLNVLPVRGRDEGAAFIVYRRNEANAKKLADFASKRGGYLNDQTPDEARFVGELLGYEEEDIKKYIESRYGKQ